MTDLALAKIVRQRREELGMSREQLGVKAGSSAATVARIELEDGYAPTVQTLRRLGQVLGIDLLAIAS